jgi:hypothetical protein
MSLSIRSHTRRVKRGVDAVPVDGGHGSQHTHTDRRSSEGRVSALGGWTVRSGRALARGASRGDLITYNKSRNAYKGINRGIPRESSTAVSTPRYPGTLHQLPHAVQATAEPQIFQSLRGRARARDAKSARIASCGLSPRVSPLTRHGRQGGGCRLVRDHAHLRRRARGRSRHHGLHLARPADGHALL